MNFLDLLNIQIDNTLPPDVAEFRDPRTGEVLCRIVNIGKPEKHPDEHPRPSRMAQAPAQGRQAPGEQGHTAPTDRDLTKLAARGNFHPAASPSGKARSS